MHCFTFALIPVALFVALSAARPIAHLDRGHHTTKVRVRENKGAWHPPVADSPDTSLLASSPTLVPSHVSGSGAEPSSIPIANPPLIRKAPSLAPPPTRSDGESSRPTQVTSADGGSSLTKKLFPYGFGNGFWTTAEGIDGARPLSDATLKPIKVLNALPRDVVKAPDGKLGMKAHYPQGSYTLHHDPLGGFSFYAKGPSDVDLSKALEATFGYSVFFEKGFGYQLGGKLLGFCK
jgi:hypothetical protein